ncbi:hypothetical protein GJ744_007518 [Endocarpon pusillum]|uniref:Uncharacterized protein n=1 Tax=Endocarpon pusillum TaxID=364733 RepID=A0A8H7A6H8_9EURO|nr:hypothetical protein GJ744_007518 [Endocarpon pusillum]
MTASINIRRVCLTKSYELPRAEVRSSKRKRSQNEGEPQAATGATQKKTTGGTAATIYKEMRDVMKRDDVMT